MGRCRIIAAVLLAVIPLCGTAQEKKDPLYLNAGIKVGVQAITYNDPEFGLEGYKFDRSNIQSNKVGYTIAPFLRISKGRFYLQTEATLGVARHSFDFRDITPSGTGSCKNNVVYELNTLCLQIPLLLGLNFVQQERFGMSVFTGPRTKFIFTSQSDQNFRHFKQEGLEEKLKKRVYYWELGLGVKIHNVFFDFVYDIGLTEASEYIQSAKEGIKYDSGRKENILSFSVGLIF